MFHRRIFLKKFLILPLLAPLSFLGGQAFATQKTVARNTREPIIKAILLKTLPQIEISNDIYQRFLEDYLTTENYYGMQKAYDFFNHSVWLYQLKAFKFIPFFNAKLKLMEESILTDFTLSTNFFFNPKVSEGKTPLIYISHWKTRPCNNPFATQAIG